MSWLVIKTFGRVRYFNISYVIMIGIPIIALIYDSLKDSEWIVGLGLKIEFPFNFKLMYVASILYAFGIAIYQFFCPAIIKRFDHEDEYVAAYLEIYLRAYPDKKYNIILTNLSDEQNETRAKIKTSFRARADPNLSGTDRQKADIEFNSLADLVYPGCTQRHLMQDFERLSKSKWALIWISGLFFLCGTGIMLFLIYSRVLLVFKV
ncbi:MAG: hypothetical protein WDO15_01415 [Bacteroidota bacterium]